MKSSYAKRQLTEISWTKEEHKAFELAELNVSMSQLLTVLKKGDVNGDVKLYGTEDRNNSICA